MTLFQYLLLFNLQQHFVIRNVLWNVRKNVRICNRNDVCQLQGRSMNICVVILGALYLCTKMFQRELLFWFFHHQIVQKTICAYKKVV